MLALTLMPAVGADAIAITYGPVAAPHDPADGGLPTSVVAYWRTDAATSANAAYVSENPGGPWTYVGTDTYNRKFHEAPIVGLTGDKTYYMYVQSADAVSGVIQFRTGQNLLVGGSFENWHSVPNTGWGSYEPDGWRGWEIYPWTPPGYTLYDHITIQQDRPTGQPFPDSKHLAHRASMDEGYRSCIGGLYQEVTNLEAGDYIISGWISYTFRDLADPSKHTIEILAKDGAHISGSPPTGTPIFTVHNGEEPNWIYVQGNATCTTGTLTVYCYLRSDKWDGASFAHFDGMRLMAARQPSIRFSNFSASRTVNGNAYDITISYDTDIPATTQIAWGPTSALGNTTPVDPNLTTHHVVQIAGVPPAAAPYHYRARATAPPNFEEFSLDKTFDAPLVQCSDVTAVTNWSVGTVCTITWNTNVATTDNKAFYRAAGSGAYTVASDASDPNPNTGHSVTLLNLELDKRYEYYVRSASGDIIPGTSTVGTFITPARPGPPWRIGMAMIGGSIPDGGDDVGPGNQVQRMIEVDHPMINLTGIAQCGWNEAQPTDPGDGPNVYDWSALDSRLSQNIPGKSVLGYMQMYGNHPGWPGLVQYSDRYWRKFQDFVTAMTIHINQVSGPIYYIFENEPNISRAPDGWNWADWYMHCLRYFYPAVHAADAVTGMQNKVIAGNLSGGAAGGFLDLYQRGLKNYSDILGHHPYPADIRDGLQVSDLAKIHSYQVQFGDADKKIYVSEGWGSGRSAGFDTSSPLIPPSAQEIENMYLAMVKGWDNVMTPRTNWSPDYLWGMKFFCGNDNWGARGWRARAIPQKDSSGNVTGFLVDGYYMTPDIAPQFWNGGMLDFYGNSKDCLSHVFPGNGLVFMNPGFEIASEPPNTNLPHFWTPEMTPAQPQYYNLDDTVLHGGSRSLRLSLSVPGYKGLWQLTAKRSAVGGVTYRARVWCKTDSVTGGAAKFYMRFWDINGTDGMTASIRHFAADRGGTSDWQQMEVVRTAPSFTSRIEVGCYLTGAGTAWFDDVTISIASQEETGTVRGYTLDEGQLVVPNCIVRTTTGGYQAISDANGYYEIPNVPTGTYDFVCRKAGYVPHRVHNQTVAAGKLTFVSFNMGIPKPGLTVSSVACDRSTAQPGDIANVTVTVVNSKPYPNLISEVNLFVEQNGADATEKFNIRASETNPKTVGAYGQAQFRFALSPKAETQGGSFSVNAYAFGQEDRPNMLQNGGFDWPTWNQHWSFTGGGGQLSWNKDTTDFYSPPNALKCYVNDNRYTWNWAHNWSAYGAGAPVAYPGRNYTIGVYHKDNLTGGVSVNLFIEEYYYDGSSWKYNGRRFNAMRHRSVWAEDQMIYETGNPAVTPGLWPTNRLVVSCGPCTSSTQGSGYSWWDDLYLKETGDWLADDRADSGASLFVAKNVASLAEALSQPVGTVVRVSGPIVTASAESFTNRVYVEQADRAAGCLVVPSGAAPALGAQVTITGKVGAVSGERALLDAVFETVGSPGVPEPLCVSGRAFLAGSKLVRGLLVTAWGQVTQVGHGGSFFVLDDGTRAGGYQGVKVVCDGTVSVITPPAPGAFVLVTGVVGSEGDGANAVLRPRSQADIR